MGSVGQGGLGGVRPALQAKRFAAAEQFHAGKLAQRLRSAGVPSSKSATSLDVIGDQLLWDRELYRFVSDHREGQRPIVAAPWRMSVAPAQIACGAPDLGEHNDYVLKEILGAHPTERT